MIKKNKAVLLVVENCFSFCTNSSKGVVTSLDGINGWSIVSKINSKKSSEIQPRNGFDRS